MERNSPRFERTTIGKGDRTSDLRLFERVCAGDVVAFEALYRLYHPRLARFLTNIVRRPQLVEEALNDTMMVVWEKANTFNGASKLSTWVFAIAYRKAMKAARRDDMAVEDSEIENRVALDPTPEHEASQARARTLLGNAIEALSADHRTVVNLAYFHELEYREIATIMDCPVDTVKTRMFHARRHLRRLLGGRPIDWV